MRPLPFPASRLALAFLLTGLAAPAFAAAAPAESSEPVHVVADGGLAIEVETVAPLPAGWALEREVAGFTGDGYLRWNGGNQYGAPGTGEIGFRLLVPAAGRYHVRLRLNTHGATRADLGNDAFTRIGDGAWTKTFIGGGQAEGWALRSKLEPKHGSFADPVYDLAAGVHRFAISGRSQGLRIDRVVIWRDGATPPDERMAAAAPTPEAPAGLAGAQRSAWSAGRFGAVLAWAERRPEDATAVDAIRRLHAFADQRVATITAVRVTDALAATELLGALAKSYQGSERGRELQNLGRGWLQDPRVAAERRARALATAIETLCARYVAEGDSKRRAAIADELRRGRELLRADFAGTAARAVAERRIAGLGDAALGG